MGTKGFSNMRFFRLQNYRYCFMFFSATNNFPFKINVEEEYTLFPQPA